MNDSLPSYAEAVGNMFENDRSTAVTSAPFGLDDVTLLSMKGVEELSQPFHYVVRICNRKRISNFTEVIGKSLTVGLMLQNDKKRYFNGVIEKFYYDGLDKMNRPLYVAEIVPWLKRLDYRQNSRIFQNLTSIEIVKQIFLEYSNALVFDKTASGPPQRIFCVQYQETDLSFVSRLLEEDGIHYFFSHSEKNHELILADSPIAHSPCDPVEIDTNLSQENSLFDDDLFWGWHETLVMTSGQVFMRDYDHEKPRVRMDAVMPVPSVQTGGVPTLGGDEASYAIKGGGGPSGETDKRTQSPPAEYEQFIFPGRYVERADAEFYAKVRSEEIASRCYRVRITGSPRQLCPGNTFKAANPYEIVDIEVAPRPNVSFLALRIETEITGEGRERDDGGRAFLYRCTVDAQPAENPYRPPLRTPRPVIPGPQTAVTVGRPGEKITTDSYGRIKVQFHWDRLGKSDFDSSCWIRTMQSWAGAPNYGGMVIPRVGMEVVVMFYMGNPDWPLVTGCVYNAINTPPADLSANPTRSVFKTRSIPGDAGQYNELYFEDAAGEEEVYLKAQKYQTTEVGDTSSLTAINKIIFKVGQSCITIDDSGITLSTNGMVKINTI
jgi:type VI secretion system secreted protein VgrG